MSVVPRRYDAAVEEILHLVSQKGYGRARLEPQAVLVFRRASLSFVWSNTNEIINERAPR